MIYLYGVVTPDCDLPSVNGVAGATPGKTVAGPIAGLTSPLSDESYRATKGDLLAHSALLAAVVDGGGDVVPVRFGTTFRDERELRERLLEPNASELQRMLAGVRGKVEVQVKVAYIEEAIVARIVAGDRRVQRLRRSTTVEARLELGRRVAESLDRQRYADARAMTDVLGKRAESASVGDATGEYGVLNASFLLPREGLTEFDDAVENLRRDMQDVVTLRYLGPLPPYSFVDAGALTVG